MSVFLPTLYKIVIKISLSNGHLSWLRQAQNTVLRRKVLSGSIVLCISKQNMKNKKKIPNWHHQAAISFNLATAKLTMVMVTPHKDRYLGVACTKCFNTHPAVVICQCRICCQYNVLLSKKFHISQSLCSIVHVNLQTDIWVNMTAYLVLQKQMSKGPGKLPTN